MKIKNKNVTQHNTLINSSFTLGIFEMRLFLFLLSKVTKEDTDFRLEKIPVELFRNESGNILYQDIMNAADKIVSRKIAIKSDEGFDYIPLLARCTYRKGEGYINIMFNQQIKSYLLQLKGNFTTSQLSELLKLKSYYSHRIYWLLKQYSTFGERHIELEALKHILGLENKYARYRDFKKYVLEKSKSELARTDMAFTFDEIRSGQKVIEINFHFQKSSSKNKLDGFPTVDEDLSEKEQRLVERLTELKLDKWQIERVLDKVGPDPETGIWKLINEIKMAKRDGIIEDLGGFTAKKLDKKYHLGFFKTDSFDLL
ncbi:replication initiation protein [Chondrinema litorale]|uniref:replication initiation protein n=1 Tax=Chondrinema litorale TaxID=2994555 RepID=UPI002543E343|nr:replication initiation protein [Chondrinema litorale]UZR99004.1 replication initiation protein [Chondrinema litorale]